MQVHERRAPALFSNLSQALLMAPLFVLLELLFVLGWNKTLHDKVEISAKARIAASQQKSE